MYSFDFDYKSKSRLPPKLNGCCHYVDDSNTGGPWYGTPENPFRYIKDGLDAASIGDIVYVSDGHYEEQDINIDTDGVKLIWLVDVNDPSVEIPTITDQTGDVVDVTADRVVISGFNIGPSGSAESDSGIDITSDNAFITNNIFTECRNGIYVHDSSNSHWIIDNEWPNYVEPYDKWPLFIDYDCEDTWFFENDFHYETIICNDDGNNACFEEITQITNIGNHYSNYEGQDSDGDGIGDTPYTIPGAGEIVDLYPLINEYKNKNPKMAYINGEKSGEPGQKYTYNVKFYDDEYYDSIFTIDWGDGTPMEHSDYIGADQEYSFEHIWSEKGTYTVRVKVTDMGGLESNWETLEVTMPKTKNTDDYNLFFEKIIDLFPMLKLIFEKLA